MKSTIKFSISLILVGLTGCAMDSSSPVEELARRDVQNSRNVGSIIGSYVGSQLGGNTPMGSDGGAFWGGYAGGKLGEAVGRVAAERRLRYASESDFVESEIAASNHAITAKRKEIIDLRRELARTRAEINELKMRRKQNEDVSSDAASKLAEVNAQIERNNSQLSAYRESIAYLDEVIASSKRQTKSTGNLEVKRNELIARRSELRNAYGAMEGVNGDYKEEKASLEPLAQGTRSSTLPQNSYSPQNYLNSIPHF